MQVRQNCEQVLELLAMHVWVVASGDVPAGHDATQLLDDDTRYD